MRAGVVVNMQLVVVFEAAEVGEAGGVVEQNTQCELRSARVACKVGVMVEVAKRLSEVLLDGLVKIESTALDQAHDDRRKGRLGQRRGGHHGIRRERQILFGVAQAVGIEVDNLATMEERDSSAGNMRGLDQWFTVESICAGVIAPVGASDCGLLAAEVANIAKARAATYIARCMRRSPKC